MLSALYKPKNINDFLIDSKIVKSINKWLQDKENKCLILKGQHGIGKTTLIKFILKDNDILSYFINPLNIKNKTFIRDIMSNLLNYNKTVFSFFTKENNDRIVVIDNFESIIMPGEKKLITDLYQSNIKMIIISNADYNKYLSESFKNATLIDIKQINRIKLTNLIKTINTNLNDNQITSLINIANSDIRFIFNILDNISNIIDKFELDDFIRSIDKKDTNIDIIITIKKLFTKTLSFEEYNNEYLNNRSILSLMIHENYYKTNVFERRKQYIPIILDSLSKSEIIENRIYIEQNYSLSTIHSFYSLQLPIILLTQLNNNGYFRIDFTKDLNKVSYLKNIVKNINELMFVMNLQFDDIFYLNHLVTCIIKDNKIQLLTMIINKYQIDIKTLERILKLNKNIDNSKLLNSKIKKLVYK